MEYEQIAFIAKYGGTLFFFLFFLTVLLYVFAPGGRKRAHDAANVVMTKDDTPIIDDQEIKKDLS
ncbi:MAG: CcoQ/FixQ family Cbb3-type cytochrome c oxidase assembly chaperone [Robiginitomaculum sp.]|nr:CcoQ/FixQ family Cbb3-type cytochrome c oxidase assembly chaperone [Robiginitomaculum sp.]